MYMTIEGKGVCNKKKVDKSDRSYASFANDIDEWIKYFQLC